MRYNFSVVEPLIDPDTVRLPADVVTVQSPVCADGVPSSELTTTMSLVMSAFEIVSGSEEKDGTVTTNTAISEMLGVKMSVTSVTAIFVVFTPLSVAK